MDHLKLLRLKILHENIYSITGKPVWLNLGITKELEGYGDEIAGITGAVEVANPELHQKFALVNL